VVQWVSALVTH